MRSTSAELEGQLEHVAVPADTATVPEAQYAQVEGLVAPVEEDAKPALQAVQLVERAASLYVPTNWRTSPQTPLIS